jgi:hypothetical protein
MDFPSLRAGRGGIVFPGSQNAGNGCGQVGFLTFCDIADVAVTAPVFRRGTHKHGPVEFGSCSQLSCQTKIALSFCWAKEDFSKNLQRVQPD